MPDPLLAFIRGTIAYLTLLVLTRLMGKRQVSQLTFFDYIVGITIGSIAGTLTTDLKVEPSVHWVGLLTWTLWTMVLGVVCVRSRRVRRFVDGEPTLVIQNGQILETHMERMGYTLDDLRMQLRENGVFNLAEVEFALLEPNGKLSVLKKSQLVPVTPADLKIPTRYKGLAVELIVDGQVIDSNIAQVDLDHGWLEEQIRARGYRIQDINYAELDTDGGLYLDLKDKLAPPARQHDVSDR